MFLYLKILCSFSFLKKLSLIFNIGILLVCFRISLWYNAAIFQHICGEF